MAKLTKTQISLLTAASIDMAAFALKTPAEQQQILDVITPVPEPEPAPAPDPAPVPAPPVQSVEDMIKLITAIKGSNVDATVPEKKSYAELREEEEEDEVETVYSPEFRVKTEQALVKFLFESIQIARGEDKIKNWKDLDNLDKDFIFTTIDAVSDRVNTKFSNYLLDGKKDRGAVGNTLGKFIGAVTDTGRDLASSVVATGKGINADADRKVQRRK